MRGQVVSQRLAQLCKRILGFALRFRPVHDPKILSQGSLVFLSGLV